MDENNKEIEDVIEEEKEEPKEGPKEEKSEKEELPKWLRIVNLVYAIVGLFAVPYCVFWLTNRYLYDSREYFNDAKIAINLMFYAIIFWILFLLIGRLNIAAMVYTGFFMLFGLADYYVLNFRGNPILPWDIKSIGVASSVAGNYSYKMDDYVKEIIVKFLILLVLEFVLELKIKWNKYSAAPKVVGIIVMILFARHYVIKLNDPQFQREIQMYPYVFQQDVMSKRNGLLLTFMYDFNFVKVDKPKGYSPKKAKKYLAEYEDGDAKGGKTPDVIVIMNESFSDLSVLGDFETNEDYMPFIHSILDGKEPDTVSGLLNVSIYGGNTPNSEYEFLTGDSLAFLPLGSIPYQQYMFGKRDSLVSQLEGLGYESSAFHPYYKKGWNRYNVYDYFGFDKTLFKEDGIKGKQVRSYYSDASVTDYLIANRPGVGDKPRLSFVVTMQNHSSYSVAFDNLPQDIKVKGLEGNVSVSNYFSLVKLTDDSVRNLINYYRNVDRDTVIVFFGDHQPNTTVTYPIMRMNGMDPEDLSVEENQLKYKVPFFIWANFDIEDEHDLEISANYLSGLMVEKAGITPTPYQNFLKELRAEYPVISAIRVSDKTGLPVKDFKNNKDIKDYNMIQYYKMFDQKNKK